MWKPVQCTLLLGLLVVVLNISGNDAQGIWDIGKVPYKSLCTAGLPEWPGFWFLTFPCKSYNGTVGCRKNELGLTQCLCNQDRDPITGEGLNYFDSTLQQCVGGVGAFCTAEHSTLFPDKRCTPHAECLPIQGEGYSVGKCQCLYGYKVDRNDDWKCKVDPDVSEGDRGTPRTTTTTQPPPREDFKLPPINLYKTVPYNETCQPKYLLNRIVCDTNSRTVSCQTVGGEEEEEEEIEEEKQGEIERRCLCNMIEDSVFDEELNMCVGLVGTWCLARGNLLGYKPCVQNADCFVEGDFDEGYSFGQCDCVYGWKPTEDGKCVRDETISAEHTSSQRTIVPPSTTTVATSPMYGRGDSGGDNLTTKFSGYVVTTLLALLYTMF